MAHIFRAFCGLSASIHTPVQIIAGREDPYGLARDAEVLNEKLPASRLDVIEGGHAVWEEQPGSYAGIVSATGRAMMRYDASIRMRRPGRAAARKTPVGDRGFASVRSSN